MGEAVEHLHQRASIIQAQIALAMSLQKSKGVDMSGVIRTYQSLLATLYGDDLPLASLSDHSDVIFHAEGPAARHHAAASGAVAWICEEAERRLRQLTAAALQWSGSSGDAASRDLAILMNGFAPGSLYIGFSIDSTSRMDSADVGGQELEPSDKKAVLQQARSAIATLVEVPSFVTAENVRPEIGEAIPDPLLRDATLMAAYHLAPTGKRGIHTLEISAPRSSRPSGVLTNRERVVLREGAVKKPILRKAKSGAFIGELREVDLDAHRFQLRSVPTLGTLRCVLDGMTVEIARRHIGKGVKVFGVYEVDGDGRPGFMRVERIEPYQRQRRLEGT